MENIHINQELLKKLARSEETLVANREASHNMTGYATIDKPWMKWHDVRDIDLSVPNTNFYDFFTNVVSQYGDVALLNFMNLKEYTLNDIENEVTVNVNRFQNLGIKKGDIVSFMTLNVPETIVMLLALNRIGAVSNLIKFDESPSRINYMLNLTKSKYFFISEIAPIMENVSKTVLMENSLEKVVVIPVMESFAVSKTSEKIDIPKFMSFDEYKEHYSKKNMSILPKCGNDDTAIIVYTGGSTGDAKGVLLTNKNLIAMAMGLKYSNYGFTPGKTSLNILPPAIAYYLNATLGLMTCGVKVILVPNFEINEYPQLVSQYKPNIIYSGPVLLKALAGSDIDDFKYLTSPVSGGDKLHTSEEEKIDDQFAAKGAGPIQQGYGSSEETAVATCNPYENTRIGSIGIPMANVTVSIFDYRTDKELKYGENNIGEICITGDTVMKGYLNNQEATMGTLFKHNDGKIWAHTDDLGTMDQDGFIYHHGRAKRMLTRQGNKLWLSALEDAIKVLPFVEECCAVKLNDYEEREVPVVHLVLKENEMTIDEMIAQIDNYLKEQCPWYFLPKYYVLKNELPITPVNKKMDFKALENEDILNTSEYTIVDRVIKPNSYCKVLKK